MWHGGNLSRLLFFISKQVLQSPTARPAVLITSAFEHDTQRIYDSASPLKVRSSHRGPLAGIFPHIDDILDNWGMALAHCRCCMIEDIDKSLAEGLVRPEVPLNIWIDVAD